MAQESLGELVRTIAAASGAYIGRPGPTEAAPFYFTYIDQVEGDDILSVLEQQLTQVQESFSRFTEESSFHRYAPGKWNVRETLSHLTDTERIFTLRALWFARGIPGELLSFDQQTAVEGAEADTIPFARHLEEFQRVRLATLSLFTNLPPAGWSRDGIASEHRVTVRALAFMTAGHAAHHMKILRERYT